MRFLKFVFFCLIPFLGISQNWQANFKEAQTQAKENHHNIILVFQGSDWCAPCMKLDREIWSNAEFQKLAKDHFVMVKADFPRKKANQLTEKLKEQNNQLAETYNPQGYFPLVVVMTHDGKVLGQTGYEHLSPEAYFNKLKAFEK